jgi:hypothetical protein
MNPSALTGVNGKHAGFETEDAIVLFHAFLVILEEMAVDKSHRTTTVAASDHARTVDTFGFHRPLRQPVKFGTGYFQEVPQAFMGSKENTAGRRKNACLSALF